MAQVRIFLWKEANFPQANFLSSRQIFDKFSLDIFPLPAGKFLTNLHTSYLQVGGSTLQRITVSSASNSPCRPTRPTCRAGSCRRPRRPLPGRSSGRKGRLPRRQQPELHPTNATDGCPRRSGPDILQKKLLVGTPGNRPLCTTARAAELCLQLFELSLRGTHANGVLDPMFDM